MEVEIEVKGKTEKMSLDMFTRWACLVDAIEVISKKCDQLGVGIDDDEWIKPNAIEKYINDRFPSMMYSFTRELQRP